MIGGVVGVGVSLVFKRKMKIINIGSGIGGGVALGSNKEFFITI